MQISPEMTARALAWLGSSGPADWLLVILGLVAAWSALRTLRAIEEQVTANAVSADAAKKSAETAALQLRAAVRPYLDLKELKIGTVNFTAHGTTGVSVEYKLYNASPNRALVSAITTRFLCHDDKEWNEIPDSVKDITISPQRGYPIGAWMNDMTLKQHEAFARGELHVSIEFHVTMNDILGNQITQTLRREVVCGKSIRPKSYLSSFQEETGFGAV